MRLPACRCKGLRLELSKIFYKEKPTATGHKATENLMEATPALSSPNTAVNLGPGAAGMIHSDKHRHSKTGWMIWFG